MPMGLILIKGLSIVGTLTTNLTFIFLIFKKNFKSLKNGKHLLKKSTTTVALPDTNAAGKKYRTKA